MGLSAFSGQLSGNFRREEQVWKKTEFLIMSQSKRFMKE